MVVPKETLLQEFQKYDKDGQGNVSASDFRKVLKEHGLGRATNIVIDNFREGEGRVDYNQFLKQCYQTNEKKRSTSSHTVQDGISRLNKLKQKIEQYKQILKYRQEGKKHFPTSRKKQIQPKITKKSKSGYHSHTPQKLYTLRDRLTKYFKQYDKNNSGKISKKEFEKSLILSGLEYNKTLQDIVETFSDQNNLVEYDNFLCRVVPGTGWNTQGLEEKSSIRKRFVIAEADIPGKKSNEKETDWTKEVARRAVGRYTQLYNSLLEKDPVNSGFISKQKFLDVLASNKIVPEKYKNQVLADITTESGNIDYNKFMTKIINKNQNVIVLDTEAEDIRTRMESEGDKQLQHTKEVVDTTTGINRRTLNFEKSSVFSNELSPREKESISGIRIKRPKGNQNLETGHYLKSYEWNLTHLPEPIAKNLTPTQRKLIEMKNEIRKKILSTNKDFTTVFRTFDKDHSGEINYAEFRDGLKQNWGIELPPQDLSLLTKELDKENTGFIDYRKFATELQTLDLINEETRNIEKAFGMQRKSLTSRSLAMESDIFNREPDKITVQRQGLKTNYKTGLSSFQFGMDEIQKITKELPNIHKLINEKATKEPNKFVHVFERADYGKNGHISYNQFQQGLKDLGLKLSDDQVLILTKIADPNKRGSIKYNNFINMMMNETPPQLETEPPVKKQGIRKVEREIEKPTPPSPQKKHFVDPKQVVTPKRHVSDESKEQETVPPSTKKDRALRKKIIDTIYGKTEKLNKIFISMDQDKDGKITVDDFKQGLEKLSLKLTIPEYERLFSYIADPQTNTVDYANFQKLMDFDTSYSKYITSDPLGQKEQKETIIDKQIPQTEKKEDLQLIQKVRDKLYQQSTPLLKGIKERLHNEDQGVSYSQFQQILTDFGLRLEQHEFDRLVEKCDKEKRGTINYNKFINSLVDYTPKTSSALKTHMTTSSLSVKEDVTDNKFQKSAFFISSPEEQRHVHVRRETSTKIQQKKDDIVNENVQGGEITPDALLNRLKESGVNLTDEEFSHLKSSCCTPTGNISYDKLLNYITLEEQKRAKKKLEESKETLSQTEILERTLQQAMSKLEKTPPPHAPSQAPSPQLKPKYNTEKLKNKIVEKIKDQNLANRFKDGQISVVEFEREMKNMGVELSKEEMEMVTQIVGTDSQGNIKYEDLNKLAMDHQRKTEIDTKIEPIFEKMTNKHNINQLIQDFKNTEVISHDEFKKRLNNIGITLKNEEFTDIINSFDKNRDGNIDCKEFAKFFTKHAETKSKIEQSHPSLLEKQKSDTSLIFAENTTEKMKQKKLQNIIQHKMYIKSSENNAYRNLFRRLGGDCESTISKETLQRGFKSMGLDFTDNDIELIVKSMGTNENGKITYEHFYNYVVPSASESKVGKSIKSPRTINKETFEVNEDLYNRICDKIYQKTKNVHDIFRKFDENHDGDISVNEFKKGLEHLGISLDDKELNTLLKVCDVDSSGTVNYKEFARIFRPRPGVSRKVEKKEISYVNRRLASELLEYVQSPYKLRSSFRIMDKKKECKLDPETFKNTILKIDKRTPEWVIDRACRLCTNPQDGQCYYEELFEKIGIVGLPNDIKIFKNTIDKRISPPKSTMNEVLSPDTTPTKSSPITTTFKYAKRIEDSGDIIGHTTPIRSLDLKFDRKLKVKTKIVDNGDIIAHRRTEEQLKKEHELLSRLHLSPGRFSRRFEEACYKRNPITHIGEENIKEKKCSLRTSKKSVPIPKVQKLFISKKRIQPPEAKPIPKTSKRQIKCENPLSVKEQEKKEKAKKKRIEPPGTSKEKINILEFKVEDKKYIPVYNEAKLEEKRIDDLKTKIEDKLSRKHVNFYDSFKQFSTSYDGHLSIDDIHKGLNEKLNISVSKDDIKKILNTNDEKINFSKFSETFDSSRQVPVSSFGKDPKTRIVNTEGKRNSIAVDSAYGPYVIEQAKPSPIHMANYQRRNQSDRVFLQLSSNQSPTPIRSCKKFVKQYKNISHDVIGWRSLKERRLDAFVTPIRSRNQQIM